MEIIGIVISALLSIITVLLIFVVNRLDKMNDKLESFAADTVKNSADIENIELHFAKKDWVLDKLIPK